MKLKFKVQPYQTHAVESVVDCFAGQPLSNGLIYRIDPGQQSQANAFEDGFKNADLVLSDMQLLENIQKVQRRQNLPVSQTLVEFTTFDAKGARVPVKATYKKEALAATRIHLDVEMETGTGKTYCYIKTIFELNKRYGWSKFIIMVPSIAIREGVQSRCRSPPTISLKATARRLGFLPTTLSGCMSWRATPQMPAST